MKEIIIPIFAMTALFVVPAVVGLIAIRLWFRSRDRLYTTIDDAIERSAPPEVIAQLVSLTESKENKESTATPIKHFSEGAFWFALGMAFLVFYLREAAHPGVVFPGIFATLYGLAKFCIAAYVARNDKRQQ